MTGAGKSRQQRHESVVAAYRAGDMAALRDALGDPPGFPDCRLPQDLAIGDYALDPAIDLSPPAFIEALIDRGADPNYRDDAGFPALISALTSAREDRHAVLRLLIDRGADIHQRGRNDWTPLHQAVANKDLEAVRILLEQGADPRLETRIDDCRSALAEAEETGFAKAVRLMRQAGNK